MLRAEDRDRGVKLVLMSIAVGLVFIFSLLFLTACEPVNRYFGLEDDNQIEEGLEAAIKYETGYEIDLTPTSPERK